MKKQENRDSDPVLRLTGQRVYLSPLWSIIKLKEGCSQHNNYSRGDIITFKRRLTTILKVFSQRQGLFR